MSLPKLNDELLWSDPRPLLSRLMIPLLDQDLHGIYIQAPEVIVQEDHDHIPIVGCDISSLQDAQDAPFFERAHLVLVSQESGEIFSCPAFEPSPEPPRKSSGRAPVGSKGQSFRLDLLQQFPFMPKPGGYRAYIVSRERRSNPVEFEFMAFETINMSIGTPPPRTIWPPLPRRRAPIDALPRYGKRERSLPLPEEGADGLEIEVQRVGVLEPDRPWVCQGSFRLSITERDQWLRSTGFVSRYAATLGISLLITRIDMGAALLYPVVVPSWNLDDEGRAIGFFELDLMALPKMWRDATTCYVHAFSATHAAGPFVTAIVTPDMLPP